MMAFMEARTKPNGFAGLRVLSLESRRAAEMAKLIEAYGGTATVAPSMREIPLGSNKEAQTFTRELLAGGFDMVSVVIRNALTQLGVPEFMRGRVGAFENIFIGASNQLGTFESGMVAAWLGAVPSVVLGGCATIVVVALWVPLFPALRRLDHLDLSSRA